MKTSTKFIANACVLVVIVTALCIGSCKKQQDKLSAQNDKASTEKVADLVTKMYAISDPSGDDAIHAVYKSLTPEEFELFETQSLEKSLEAYKKELENANGRLSSSLLETINAQVQEAKEFRKALNQQAIAQYGKPRNQLSPQQVLGIVEKVQTGKSNLVTNSVQIQGCTKFTSNTYAATQTNTTGNGYNWSGREDNDENATFCDYVFSFPGFHNKVFGERPVDRDLISWSGGYISREVRLSSNSYHTRLLFGYYTVSALYWPWQNPYLRMRFE